MAFDGRVKVNPAEDESNNPLYKEHTTTDTGGQVPEIIRQNPQMPLARRNRQLIKWKIPGMGFVEMYINPQNMNIVEQKVIRSTRTKGGYVMQYWGEELAKIKISGTTGASSIEGINILRRVYRAEQDAFQQVEQVLSDRLQEYTSSVGIGGLLSQGASAGAGSAIGTLVNTITGGAASPPLLPTLASLAAAVELYYQGWVFKGYFEGFTVDEAVAHGPGIFNYTMDFAVLDRRGERKNFTEWSRSPATYDSASGKPTGYFKSDAGYTPLSYRGEDDK
jgi:hypothetical protein